MSPIEVVDVHRRFGPTVALAGVDLEVRPGTVHALLGPNGAGKSTLVRVLCTLLRPDRGTARVAGHDVVRQRRAVRQQIGVVGQFPTVDDQLTGRENLRLVAQLCRMPARTGRHRAEELLDRFGLQAAADRRAESYSGGMRRRLDLAAGLMHRPAVLLLDEPTTGLDPIARRELWNQLEELTSDGTTILLTTQHFEEAERLAQDVTILHAGVVAARGSTADLKRRFGRTVIEVAFRDQDRADRAQVALGAGGLPFLSRLTPTTVRVHTDEPGQAIPRVVRHLDSSDAEPLDFTVRQPTLDDVLAELVEMQAAG